MNPPYRSICIDPVGTHPPVDPRPIDGYGTRPLSRTTPIIADLDCNVYSTGPVEMCRYITR